MKHEFTSNNTELTENIQRASMGLYDMDHTFRAPICEQMEIMMSHVMADFITLINYFPIEEAGQAIANTLGCKLTIEGDGDNLKAFWIISDEVKVKWSPLNTNILMFKTMDAGELF